MSAPNHDQVSTTDLRSFGLITSALLILFFVVLIPWIWDLSRPLWPWIVAVVLSLAALAVPDGLRPIYRVWMRFAEILGWINTRIILGLIFYVIFVPFGFLMRLVRDPMRRKLDQHADSYRVPSPGPKPDNMEKPF